MPAAIEENMLWSKSATAVVLGSFGISPVKELLRRNTTRSLGNLAMMSAVPPSLLLARPKIPTLVSADQLAGMVPVKPLRAKET
jgi:hypothetical protein